MKSTKFKSIALLCASLLFAQAANAHIVSVGWKDNGNGSVTLWGEHWHGDQTSPSTANGGITIDDGVNTPYKVQWNSVQNNLDRDDLLANGTFDGFQLDNPSDTREYMDWLITDPLVIGNGTYSFFTGTNCCIDTMSAAVNVTLTGITSVASGTGPGEFTGVAAVPEPETYAMFLAGLGLMGFVARRKQA